MAAAFDGSKQAGSPSPAGGTQATGIQDPATAVVVSESSDTEKNVGSAAKGHPRSAFPPSTKWMIVILSSYAGIFS
jgi:hypothetical protein